MFINGEWCEASTGNSFEVVDPATGAVIGSMPDGTTADAERAIGAADAAFAEWSATTTRERSDMLLRAWQIMTERAGELAELMTREQGKPLKAARNEVNYAADFLRYYSEEATLVAMVTPWNYPISMLTRKMGPALAAGCTLVLKPAEDTPLCAKAVFDVFIEAGIPAGVINMVTGKDPKPIGEVFTSDPRVRKITFTGSTPVGRMLAGQAAANLKRVSVELGGHAPFIVFPDADPVRAAKGAAALKFLNSGQACISPNRLYVSEQHADAFTETMVERVAKVSAGNGFTDGVGVGPLVNEAAVAKVEAQVNDAVGKGAAALVGGHRLSEGEFSDGHFFAPTLLSGVTDTMTIYREETFGPVAPIITYGSVEEVVALANDTEYGLAAYVYTNNISTAIRTAEGLRFGIIGVNDVNPTSASVPFGGMKDSGLGREGSHDGIEEYLETKSIGFAV
jgi:succinate-semialdehyde dehydrogenase/glutarate-semialdehyde dehydrogenase